ncbi:MAG: outer membrane lipoprotein carrier protein LolA [Myxococcota bacterium]|nr:outer membrane lipoprotein carrier protein LolA [Myxococcota bacterium]
MKRRALLLVIPVTVLAPRLASAQGRPSASEVAASMQSFYGQRRTVQSRFTQTFVSRVYRRTQTSRGRLSIQRPGRIRFDYDEPSGKVLVSDGTSWTMYEPIEGGPGQYSRGSTAAASTTAFGILMGTVDLADYRQSLRAPVRSDPPHTDALELVPSAPSPHYRRIVAYVDRRSEHRGVVRRVSIEDPDGNGNQFDFTELRFDQALDPSTFRFTPPRGARELGRR